jgi:hypothetical protein
MNIGPTLTKTPYLEDEMANEDGITVESTEQSSTSELTKQRLLIAEIEELDAQATRVLARKKQLMHDLVRLHCFN